MHAHPRRTRIGRLKSLPVHRLERGALQPRRAIDGAALKKLAESILTEGVIQPIFVRKARRGKFEIVAGERRWHAAKMAGLKSVPTVVGDVSDEAALAIALIENLHREDLNPIDQALAMQRLTDEFGMTHQEIADMIGKSRAAVTNLLRLLELPVDVQGMVSARTLDMGHARALLALPREQHQRAARYVVSERLSVRDVERMAKASPRDGARPVADESARTSFILAWLRRKVRRSICLRLVKSGRYRLSFSFSTPEELRSALEEAGGLADEFERVVAGRHANGAHAERRGVAR